MNAVADEASRPRLSSRYKVCPAKLLGTDRILKRWAVSVGDGTFDLAWYELAKSRFPPLDDQMAIVVDQLILRAPPRPRRIVELWYRRPDDHLTDIAIALHMREEHAKQHWLMSLEYFRLRFLESPLSALRRLAATNPEGAWDLATPGVRK